MRNAVAIHRMGYPFGVYDPLGGEIKKIFQQDFGVLRHQHFAGLGLRFQAGRQIDRSANGGVIQTAGTSEIPDITESRINSDSDFQIGGEGLRILKIPLLMLKKKLGQNIFPSWRNLRLENFKCDFT